MALNYSQVLFLLLGVSMLGLSMANKEWQNWYDHNNRGFKHGPQVENPGKIIVGGSENWRFNFSYVNWALRNGPFYVNDTLVFKYDPPSDNNTHPHNVYLLPNLRSFLRCDLSQAQMIANVSDGAGDGFEFVLNRWQPYYFACGASNGFHCNVGLMKFFVIPMLRRWPY